jgi:hypothetical protein
MKKILLSLLIVTAAARSTGQAQSQGAHRIEIFLEKYVNGGWQGVDSRLVFDQNDLVRFRVRSNFSGYLYVTNLGTSGRYEVLFPSSDAGSNNKIESSKDYVVPATSQGSFRVTGPAGQEIVYWVISPNELDKPTAPQQPARRSPTLIPRCDDTVMRARGDCIDNSAGPKAIEDRNGLPADVAKVPNAKSRDLVIMQKEKSSIVGSPVPLSGPAIYEFRLSHR